MNETVIKKKSKKDKVVTHKIDYIKQDDMLPIAIIVDIDGTVALIQNRSPFDATKWHQDIPHNPIITLIEYAILGICDHEQDEEVVTVLFITGREGGMVNYLKTEEWLEEHTLLLENKYEIFMRQPGDYRGDVEVKREIYEEHVKDKYNVYWVFEDRNKMVNFWRNDLKLPTLQVKDGDY